MKKSLVYWVTSIVFFILYFLIVKYIWNKFIPLNAAADLIALFVLIFINVPISLISTQKVFKIIKIE